MTASGVFIQSYVLFNYIGVMLFALFPDIYYWVVPDTTFDPSDDTFLKAGTIATLGLLSAILGIVISGYRKSRKVPAEEPKVGPQSELPAGFSIPWAVGLLFVTTVFAFGMLP